ncbi:ATP-binding protein [Actinosynnema sp. NPDC050436]|uniref:ATP-binding protein n=1 Tax=Actinosynnema sp. NPDC050436 TaxID=3155659 RepID=UPI0033C80B8D
MTAHEDTAMLVMVEPGTPSSDEVTRWLRERLHGRPDHEVTRVGVVAGELVDNAWQHSGPPYVLRLTWAPDRDVLVVSVFDHPTTPIGPWRPGAGLALVEVLSAGWGVETAGNGAVVWAELRFED